MKTLKIATELFSVVQVMQDKLDALEGTSLYQKAMKYHAKLLQEEISKLLKKWYHADIEDNKLHDAHNEMWRIQGFYDEAISKVFDCPIELLNCLPAFLEAFNNREIQVHDN